MIVFLAGLVLVVCGFVIIFNPASYSTTYGMTFNFSDIKYPLGGAFIVIGTYYLYRAAKLQNSESQCQHWICPQCQETFALAGDDKNECKQCNVELEKLDGFYERHPDLHV